MPSILWGADTGADVCLPFNGNCSLSGAQLLNAGAADDDVALAFNELVADAHTRNLFTCNSSTTDDTGVSDTDIVWEAGHTGVTLETSAPWLGAGHNVMDSLASGIFASDAYEYTPAEGCCWEVWALVVADTKRRTLVYDAFNASIPYHSILICNSGVVAGRLQMQIAGSALSDTTGNTSGWHHYAAVADATSTRFYRDGTLIDTKAVAPGSKRNATRVGRWYNAYHSFWNSSWDQLAYHSTARYTGSSFACGRMKSSAQNGGVQPYVQVTGTGLAGMLPTAVSWTAQTGSAYGRIHSVWVNDVTGGWTQVGGAYPTSPVSVAGLTLASNDAVRVSLEPETASGIQNASPTLYGVRLDWAAPSVSFVPRRITPVRIGPRLLPIGVIF